MPEIDDYKYQFHKFGGQVTIFSVYRWDNGTTDYYQYVNGDGKWYIMRTSTSGNVKTYEYYKPSDYNTEDIDTGWTNRTSKTYSRYDEVFS